MSYSPKADKRMGSNPRRDRRAGWIEQSFLADRHGNAKSYAGKESASLQSSIHIVCRPRVNGCRSTEESGDWRDVLQELPRRIHEWMPRLAEEGVVGADAIFACLGPALEIFSALFAG